MPKTSKASKAKPAPKKAAKIGKPVKPATQPNKKVSAKVKDVKNKSADDSFLLEVCLMLDCTASMMSWINRSKDTLKEILQNIREQYKGLKIRVSFVGYRDINDYNRFDVFAFSEDIDACVKFISKENASGGADAPEDV